jgi:hypothetical protein
LARRTEIDVLRGLMLVLITITHLPTVFSAKFSQPFGFVSAAEGFVFLSAFLQERSIPRSHAQGSVSNA